MFIVLLSHAIDCYLGNKVGIQLLVQAIIREVGNTDTVYSEGGYLPTVKISVPRNTTDFIQASLVMLPPSACTTVV